jgi:hypothetical protein
MLKKGLMPVIIIVSLLMGGCILQEPQGGGSFSAIPAIKLDYNEDEQVTGIWVESALGFDFKYDNITVEISWNNYKNIRMMNQTYCIVTQTHLNKFYINVTAYIEDNEYFYAGLVEINPDDENVFSITRYEEEESEEELVEESDLPWKALLRRKD